ncbi:MAG: hypothetical protein K2X99_07480 [Gemmatimonadaceae bacterium]|nr:hypothetical protein [Gemmatimonadaceae bacterium]
MLRRLLAAALVASAAQAQSYNAPAFQPSRLTEREYNFAAADAGRAGTSLLVQWREGWGARAQFGAEAGLASPNGANAKTRTIIGAQAAWRWLAASDENPFDVLLTGSLGGSFADDANVTRFAVGAVAGHAFPLEGGMTLTGFAHPRLSLDGCSSCVAGKSDSKLAVDFDLGAELRVTPRVALRVAALFGGADYLGTTNAIGFSVAWTPAGLRRP